MIEERVNPEEEEEAEGDEDSALFIASVFGGIIGFFLGGMLGLKWSNECRHQS